MLKFNMKIVEKIKEEQINLNTSYVKVQWNKTKEYNKNKAI